MRLQNQTLSQLRIPAPTYNRQALRSHIVHIGVGSFHRAHQAVYLDDLCQQGLTDWGICGAGLLPRDQRLRDVLKAQDYLYTVLERSAEGNQARAIGTLVDYLLARTDSRTLIDRLADPATRIVSLTVTEGGYCLDQTTGELDLQHPDVRYDLNHPDAPQGLYGYLLAGLQRRYHQGLPPFTVMSCDNIQGNGNVVKQLLLAAAGLRDPQLGRWLEQHGAFPNSMVDRITPLTTEADRVMLQEQFAIEDDWPVVCEPFRQWVIEDQFAMGRPPWQEAGALFTTDVQPYELMKLRLLNASHAAMAYFGALLGYRTVAEIMTDDLVRRYVRSMMDNEVTELLPAVPGVDLAQYKNTLIERFSNPAIKDQVSRLCQDGSDRQPKFILPSIREQLQRNGPCQHLVLAHASWCRYLVGHDEQGKPVPIDDPIAQKLQQAAQAARHGPEQFLHSIPIYDETLRRSQRFHAEFGKALTALYQNGVRATLQQMLSRA